MENDPVRFGIIGSQFQDASVLLNCIEKTPTLSVFAFALRTSEYIAAQFKAGAHISK